MSTSTGPEYYVNVLSIVDKAQLEPGCTVLLHNKGLAVVGLLADEADPMVSVMKARCAPPPPFPALTYWASVLGHCVRIRS